MARPETELPQDFKPLLYPDGAVALPRAYERIVDLLSQAKNPDGFLDPFLCGDLTIKVFDRGRNRIFALDPKRIEAYVSEYGSAELLFDRDVIVDVHGGPLAEFDGMAPYVEGSEFESWQRNLDRGLSPPQSGSPNRPPRAQPAEVLAFLMDYADGTKREADCRAAAKQHFTPLSIPDKAVWRPAWGDVPGSKKLPPGMKPPG